MKPATPRARKLRTVLQALSERGVDGERDAAKKKLDRLLKRFDFTAKDDSESHLFDGIFYPASEARLVYRFDADKMAIAASIKWAIEESCKVICLFRGLELWAEVRPETAEKLSRITATIDQSFRELWQVFKGAPAASEADQPVFIRGLYDGMMNEAREDGGTLPPRVVQVKVPKAKRRAMAPPIGICPHPYTVAVKLGQRIRFQVPLPEIEHELKNLATPQLPA